MVIGLLLVALVALVLGLVLASAPFLIGSLVASLVAGFLLWRQRGQSGGSTAAASSSATASGTQPTAASRPRALVTGTAFARQSASPADRPDDDVDVWVVDGQPDFHTQACAEIAGEDSEPISRAQAVEDGFTPCAHCRPDAAAPSAAAADRSVEGEADPPPPDSPTESPNAAAESAPAPVTATTGAVWVVDGRPRYHLADCMIIKDQAAEEIPLAQATEDGFIPCTMCEPNVTRV